MTKQLAARICISVLIEGDPFGGAEADMLEEKIEDIWDSNLNQYDFMNFAFQLRTKIAYALGLDMKDIEITSATEIA